MDYILELDKAIRYIEDNLKDRLDLETISAQVNISSFHFHRIFKAVVHETVMGYVRSRRLTLALRELLTTNHRIIDIAMDHMFESQESFTRAFKSYFGITPGKARKTKEQSNNGRPAFSVEVLKDLVDKDRTDPEVIRLPNIKLIGVQCDISIPIDMEKFSPPDAWQKLSRSMDKIKNRVSGKSYGVQMYPEYLGPDNEVFRYIASVEVTKFEDVPEGMIAYELPERTYIVYKYKGIVEPDTMTKIFANIYGQWILNVPYKLKTDFDFEFYDGNFNPNDPDSYMCVYIPIVD